MTESIVMVYQIKIGLSPTVKPSDEMPYHFWFLMLTVGTPKRPPHYAPHRNVGGLEVCSVEQGILMPHLVHFLNRDFCTIMQHKNTSVQGQKEAGWKGSTLAPSESTNCWKMNGFVSS